MVFGWLDSTAFWILVFSCSGVWLLCVISLWLLVGIAGLVGLVVD